jgi:NAD(P)-dependent dehydrogenase (short-subunit alcohol dehydrogenase family)
MKLQSKVAVITGAGSGIGRASAKLFAKEGAKVLIVDINEKALSEVVKEIKQAGGEATAIVVDVGKVAENQRMIETAVKTYGRIDILFNNAGIAGEGLAETTEEMWRRTIDINLTGPYFACTFAIPYMRKQGGGVILNTGSTGGLRASGRSPSYTATKGGIIMLSRALAKILAKDNIRVNCICPGSTETGLSDAFAGFPKTDAEKEKAQANRHAHIPLGRQARPEEQAAVALFMVSDDASFVDGVAWLVDGGALA